MGFTPQQVDAMSVWQVMSICEGYAEVHAVKDTKLSEGEKDEIWEWMQEKPDTVRVPKRGGATVH